MSDVHIHFHHDHAHHQCGGLTSQIYRLLINLTERLYSMASRLDAIETNTAKIEQLAAAQQAQFAGFSKIIKDGVFELGELKGMLEAAIAAGGDGGVDDAAIASIANRIQAAGDTMLNGMTQLATDLAALTGAETANDPTPGTDAGGNATGGASG